MATQHEILRIISASGPISRNKIGELVGEEYRNFQSQLNRLSKRGYVQDTGDHIYTLTDAGHDTLKTMGHTIKLSREEGFRFAITETDLMMLDDESFIEAWALLGKCTRNRYPHQNKR